MRRLIAFFLSLMIPFAAPAALAAPTQAPSERMAPLSGLIGEWRGSGWTMLPDGTRSEFESRETVTPRLSGAALLVEGRHFPPGDPDTVVHDAMGMITWDARANAYRFRTALANGMGGDFAVEVGDGTFTWRMETPGGRIEFVTDFRGGTWREQGWRIAPGGERVQFFEMTLTRQ